MIVRVNGQTIEVPDGASISVNNGTVVVNETQVGFQGSRVQIAVEGGLASLTTNVGDVEVKGDVGPVRAGGSVKCNNVQGNVDAGGSVQCGPVTGSVDAGGSVTCGSVGGDVDAGGSVRHG